MVDGILANISDRARGLPYFGPHANALRANSEGCRLGTFFLARNINFLALPDTEHRDVAEFIKTILGT